jgi:hypothetical protein
LTPQIYDSAGGRGGPRLFVVVGILVFLLVRREERGERERKMPSLMATSFRRRTHSARTIMLENSNPSSRNFLKLIPYCLNPDFLHSIFHRRQNKIPCF